MTNKDALEFGDFIINVSASDDNPIKKGRFVRKVYNKGKLNSGVFVEYIDDNGVLHKTTPDNIRRAALTPPVVDIEALKREYIDEFTNEGCRAFGHQELIERVIDRFCAQGYFRKLPMMDVKTDIALIKKRVFDFLPFKSMNWKEVDYVAKAIHYLYAQGYLEGKHDR